ncbi:hypothetical protein ACNF2I_22810 (plasmid) [Escherichia coli]
MTPTRAKHPPPPCKAGFGGLSDDTAAGTVARHNGPVERAGWPPCKAGFGGLSDDTAAGTVARHNGPVERAGWRVATGRA